MKFEIEKSGPKLSIADIEQVERQYGFKFPVEYKNFLLNHNGGKPEKYLFRFKGKRQFTECVHYFLALSDDPNISFFKYYQWYKIDAKRLPDEMIPVAFDPGGNLICISVSGEQIGAVLFWDHEGEFIGRDRNYGSLRLIAASFKDFLNDLRSDSES